MKTGLELGYQINVLVIVALLPIMFLAITNSVIFIFVRRSTRRVQVTNSDHHAPATTLNQRDARLLKHMIFMFATFFFTWVPIYIIGVIAWDGVGIPYIEFNAWLLLPPVGFLINMFDLFLYNHELRTYINNKLRNRPNQ